MNRTKLCACLAAIAMYVGLFDDSALAQRPEAKGKTGATAPSRPAGAADQLVVRVYNVGDLVLATPHYPYRGTRIPMIGNGSGVDFPQPAVGGGSATGGGGGMGGMSGGMGGGGVMGAAESHESDRSARFDIAALQQVLQATVDPETWNPVGGQGVCQALGTLLVIRQTQATHEKIIEFLTEVRRSGGCLRPVTIVAYWVSVDAKGLAELVAAPKDSAPVAGKPVNKAALERLASGAKTVHGQVTCFDSQTVHIISGQGYTVTTGVNPVVAAGAVAFDPALTTFHSGAMLQVTPTLSAGGNDAVLDLQSTFLLWQKPDDPIEVQGQVGSANGGAGNAGLPSAKLDRIQPLAQQLSTTLRVPLGQPVLVGGMTSDPSQADSSRLYLIVEATAGDAIDDSQQGGKLVPRPMPPASGTPQNPSKK